MKTKCIICETIIKTKSNKRVSCGGDCSIIYGRVCKILTNRFNHRKQKQVEELEKEICKVTFNLTDIFNIIDNIFKVKK